VAGREPPHSTPAVSRTMTRRSMRRTVVTVLGEIPDQETALRELRRVLKPGGRLVVRELFGDPHLVAERALRLRAQPAADGSRG